MHKEYLILLSFIFSFLFILPFVIAADNYNYYFEEAVAPKKERLEVKSDLLVDSFSGAAVYDYPLTLPPGTNGLKPNIGLRYNSHTTGDGSGMVGTGWSISESYIQRDTNYSFGNTSDDDFILVFDGVSYDLRYSSITGRYHTKTESFLFVNSTSGGQNENGKYWVVRNKDGTNYRFGFYNFSEALSNKYNYTWRWYLDLVNDTYNNSIFYNYSENPFPQDQGVTYLRDIKYNNDAQRRIDFYYGSQNVPQLRFGYDEGNLVSRTRKLNEIAINVSNQTLRKYVINYEKLGSDQGNVSSISNLTEYGSGQMVSLPPVEFGYSQGNRYFELINWSYSGCFVGNFTGCFVDPTGQDYGVRLADLNGDGLVDIFRSNTETLAWFNNGTGFYEVNWTHEGCEIGLAGGCFWTGQDSGARLTDLNGDGLVDVFKSVHNVGIFVYINNGSSGWHHESWTFSGCLGGLNPNYMGCLVDTSGKDLGVRLLDLNGDGFVDMFKARYNGANVEKFAWLGTGQGWYSINWTYPGCIVGNISGCFVGPNGEDYGTRQADVNGDGLVDVVNMGSVTTVWLNNGTGFEEIPWTHDGCDPGLGGGCLGSGSDLGVRLVDLNGDGLVDVSRAYNAGGIGATLEYEYINNGTAWVHDEWYLPGCENGISNIGCYVNTASDDLGVRLVDLNGDGLIDIFKARHVNSSTTDVLAWISTRKENYLLKNINTSLGGEISISYQTSTSLNNTRDNGVGNLGFNLWLVSNTTKDNKVGNNQRIVTNTSYILSKGFYNQTSKKFKGFGFSQEISSNKKINRFFHQEDFLEGMKYKEELLDNQGNIHKTYQQNWNYTNKGVYYVVNLDSDSEATYDGSNSSTPKTVNRSYAYDNFGNLIYTHYKGDVENSEDDYYEYTSYANNSNSWIVNKLKNYTVLGSDNSTIIRQSKYSYDGFAYGLAPTKGSTTFKEDVLIGGSNKNSSYRYNSFGNVVNMTDSRGNKVNYSYGVSDPSNTFVDSEVNSRGFKTKYKYDLGSGNLLNQTNPNQLTTDFTYDAFSIDKDTILPLDNPSYPTQEYKYNFDNLGDGKIIVKQREESGTSNTLDSYKFYDGFGRLIQSKSEAAGGSTQITVDYFYDDLGRLVRQSNPYFTAFSENYTVANQSIPFTSYEYDVLDRIVKIRNIDNSIKNFTFDRWNITIFDENGNKKMYQTNFRGNIIKVVEYDGSNAYSTSYKYNSVGELVLINDSLGNLFTFTYDSLGRKTAETDPDRGSWNYTYDSEGNLIRRTDNRGTTLIYSYDSLNRKLNETGNGTTFSYVYDLKLNGTLSSVSTSTGSINYSYDNRSRKTVENRYISGIRYSGNWSYDSADRVTSQVMPDGRTINFTYNEQGLISAIPGFAVVDYNENSNPVIIEQDNNVDTEYTYNNSNFRLLQINTTGNKQKLNYLYDGVGNVLNINDSVHNITYELEYDSLNRLANTTISGKFDMLLGFIYDQIGNIRNVTGTYATDYSYQDSRPHATSKVVFY